MRAVLTYCEKGMRRFRPFVVIFAFAGPIDVASAQAPSAEALDLRASGEAYLRSIRGRVDTDVGYYDPSRAAPDLNAGPFPSEIETERDGLQFEDRAIVIMIAVAVLALILSLFWKYGASFSVSLRAEPSSAERLRNGSAKQASSPEEIPKRLREILAMKDRKDALIALAHSVLAAVVGANGLLFQKSWTARDALQKLPASQPYLEAVRSLVLVSEHVQFGDRSVEEEEFLAYVQKVRPLLAKGGAG